MSITKTEIDLRLFDDDIEDDSTYSATDIQSFANLADLKVDFDAPVDYATLENDQWRLDGSMDIFPVDMSTMKFGYWSESQSDSLKDISIVFGIDFTEPQTSIGITFIFYAGDYATDIEIKWYDSTDTLILDKTFTNDRNICFIDQEVEDYQRIEVTFLKNNKSGHYIKLAEIGFGADVLFTDANIKKCSIVEELNPISDEISINKMTTEIYVKDEENIKEIYDLLQKQQKIIVYEYVDDVKKEMGTFYLKNRSNPNANTMKFETEDLIGALSQTEYKGMMFNDTFENVINSIMADFGTSLYEISDELKDLVVSGYIPITDYRRAIQLVAFSVNAVVDCSRTNKIKIYKLSTSSPQTVDSSRYFIGSSQTESERVTGVSLALKSYSATAVSEEIYNVTHTAGTYETTFSEPYSDLTIQNGIIIESGVNYATFTSTGSNVIISGKPYTVSNQTFAVNMSDLPSNVNKNILKFENSVIWDGNQNAQNIYDKSINLNEKTMKMLLTTESVGDYVEVGALYEKVIDGYIESLTIDLTGGFLGTAVVSGVTV